ncbi:MAG: hypothetical protein ACYCQI_03535 [Gammaproteobacteria bacterium]
MSIKRMFIASALLVFSTISVSYAAEKHFNCPDPSSIQVHDFTVPAIWVAPPVPHSAPGEVGAGLGGKAVKEFVGAEAATIDHRPGWVCIYKTEGSSIREYQAKILNLAKSNKFLQKYIDKVQEEFDRAEPYLAKYPSGSPLGFVGYVREK